MFPFLEHPTRDLGFYQLRAFPVVVALAVRFTLDALRTGDARYFGWTPGRYLPSVATLVGVGILPGAFRPRASLAAG